MQVSIQPHEELTVCFSGKSSSGSSFKPTMMCSFGALVQEPVGTSVAPVPSYSLSSKMLNEDLSTWTVYPASTSCLAVFGGMAVRCSNGLVSARTWRTVDDIAKLFAENVMSGKVLRQDADVESQHQCVTSSSKIMSSFLASISDIGSHNSHREYMRLWVLSTHRC